jgi:hypothetical protein
VPGWRPGLPQQLEQQGFEERNDGRATLAWFSANYMKFTGVERMPSGQDEHHTIPRVVFAQRLRRTGFCRCSFCETSLGTAPSDWQLADAGRVA